MPSLYEDIKYSSLSVETKKEKHYKIHSWCKMMERSYYIIIVFDNFKKSLYTYKKHREHNSQSIPNISTLDIKTKLRILGANRSKELIDMVYKDQMIEIYFQTKSGLTFTEEEKILDSIQTMIETNVFKRIELTK